MHDSRERDAPRQTAAQRREKAENPWLSLGINIVIPALILMKLSGEDRLGPVVGLLAALAFPLTYGIVDGLRRRRFNFISALGVVSILLTGGIGLLQLDTKWIAIKEAAVPGVIGLVVLLSMRSRYPIVRRADGGGGARTPWQPDELRPAPRQGIMAAGQFLLPVRGPQFRAGARDREEPGRDRRVQRGAGTDDRAQLPGHRPAVHGGDVPRALVSVPQHQPEKELVAPEPMPRSCPRQRR